MYKYIMKSQFTYSVPKAVGVKKAGIPAPPARMRSARVPCNDVKHKYTTNQTNVIVLVFQK